MLVGLHAQVRILHAHMFQTVQFAVARIISLRELFNTSCVCLYMFVCGDV